MESAILSAPSEGGLILDQILRYSSLK